MAETSKNKRAIRVALTLLVFLIILLSVSTSVSAATLGDVNGDGVVNILDVVLVNGYVLGNTHLTATQKYYADVNRDGKVDIYDNILLMQMVSGIIYDFPTVSAPVLSSPANQAYLTTSTITFEWSPVSGASKYELEVTRADDGSVFRNQVVGSVYASIQYGFPNDGSQFRWRVRAGNSDGWGSWSSYRSFTSGSAYSSPAPSSPSPSSPAAASPAASSVPVPSTPSLGYPAAGANVAGSSVSFQWSAVTYATKYQLEVSRSSDGYIFRNVELIDRVNTTLSGFYDDATEYRWRVRAGNDSGWSSWTSYRYFTNGTSLVAPNLGSPASNAVVEGTAVSFNWNSVTGATRYELEVVRISDGYIFKSVPTGSNTGTTQSGFPNDGSTDFRWRVRAGNATSWGAWSAYRTFTSGSSGESLLTPTLTSPASGAVVSGSSVVFRWNPVSGATRYQLRVYQDSGQYLFKDVTLGNQTASEQFGFTRDGSQYSWQVRAGNQNGWGGWSALRSFTNGELPAAPVLTSPLNTESGRQVTFRWNAVTGAEQYELEVVNERTGAFEVKRSLDNVTSWLQRGFQDDGTSYKWRVRARSKEGWGPWSGYATFVNGSAPGKPSLVSPANNENITTSYINFQWEPVPGADRYQLRILDSEGDEFRLVNIGNRTTSLQQYIPRDGSLYTWQVQAGNVNGFGDNWSAERSFTIGSPIGTPVQLTPGQNAYLSPADQVYDTEIDFSWTAVTGADYYELEVETYLGAYVDKRTNISETSFSLDGFDDQQQYRWRVRAVKDVGGTVFGTWSGYRNFIYYDDEVPGDFSAPILRSPIDGTRHYGNTITFKWTPVPGGPEYEIEIYSAVNGAEFHKASNVDNLENGEQVYDVAGFPQNNSAFIWRVRAVDGDGSPWSFFSRFSSDNEWWNF